MSYTAEGWKQLMILTLPSLSLTCLRRLGFLSPAKNHNLLAFYLDLISIFKQWNNCRLYLEGDDHIYSRCGNEMISGIW